MLESLSALDQIRIHFSASGSLALNIILAFIMFGVALDIRPKEFSHLFKKPKALITGLASQLVFVPALTFLIILALHNYLSSSVCMGMILVAACPGGNMANFICNYSRGKIELSIAMTATNTVLAIFTTPLNFAFWGNLYTNYLAKHSADGLLQPLVIDPYQMFETVFIILGIPLLLGMLTAHYKAAFARKIAPWFQRFSIVAFIAMIVIAFSNNVAIFVNYISLIFLIVLVQNGLAFFMGWATGTLFKVTDKERRAMTIESGIHNSGLGLALLLNPKIFPQDAALGGMLLVTAWWGIWHIIAGLTLGTYWHRKPVKD
jgi:bile acid:Na+ symporter, BASS family